MEPDQSGGLAPRGDQGVLGLLGVLAPEESGVAEADVIVVDEEEDGVRGLALEDDHVEAGVLEVGAELAGGRRVGDGAGQR